MKSISINNIPGLREYLAAARQREFEQRGDAWLDLTHDIAGIRVRTMVVGDYVMLLRRASPLLHRQAPAPADLAFFLWMLSPEVGRWVEEKSWRKPWLVPSVMLVQGFIAGRNIRRKLKLGEIERLAPGPDGRVEIPEGSRFAAALTGAFKYIDLMFFDEPAGLKVNGAGSGLHYIAHWFATMENEYGKSEKEIWRMPLPKLFARLRHSQMKSNPQTPAFSGESDKVNQIILRGLRAKEFTMEDLNAGRVDLKKLFNN